MTTAHMDGGNDDPFRRQPIHQQADGNDIRHGVHRSHLVEVDLRHRNIVGAALRLCDKSVDGHRVVLHRLGQMQAGYNMLDPVQAVVLVRRVLMLMRVFMLMLVFMFMFMSMPMRVFVLMLMCVLVVVMMGMRMIGFFHTIYRNRHMCAGDAALYGHLPAILHAGNAESVQLVHKAIRVRQQLQQCRGQHIASGAHAAIQIQSFHDFASM